MLDGLGLDEFFGEDENYFEEKSGKVEEGEDLSLKAFHFSSQNEGTKTQKRNLAFELEKRKPRAPNQFVGLLNQ